MEIQARIDDSGKIRMEAVEYEEIYGFIEAIIEDSDVSITCLYVAENYRRNGIATLLMDELCDLIYEQPLPIDMNFTYFIEDGTKGIDEFMKNRLDFRYEKDEFEYLIEPDLWHQSPAIKQFIQSKDSSKGLDFSDSQQIEVLIDFFDKFDLDVNLENQEFAEYFSQELSQIAYDKNNEAVAAILVHKSDEKKLIEISAVACEESAQLMLAGLAGGLFTTMKDNYSDYSIRFLAINSLSTELAEKLFNNNGAKKVLRTAVWTEI